MVKTSKWKSNLKKSEKRLDKWLTRAKEIDKLYRADGETDSRKASSHFKLNLFHSNTQILLDQLFSNLPDVAVDRRFFDHNDDVARVASILIERVINRDIAKRKNNYNDVLKSVLSDRLLGGLGVAKVSYKVEDKNGQIASEDAPLQYIHWEDVRYSEGRCFNELNWIAFRSKQPKNVVKARFGDKITKALFDDNKDADDKEPEDAEIWEIWDKTSKKVRWLSDDYPDMLDEKDDPLKLNGFFPCPEFLIANNTTSKYIPTPEYVFAQDLYTEIDQLQTRISMLTTAVKVVGVYDKSADGVQSMLNTTTDNKMIPVDNWALFAEKGGLRGQIDWMPIDTIVQAISQLKDQLDRSIDLLYQVTGLSDLMRGQVDKYESAAATKTKTAFGSVRIQSLQQEFADFVTNLLQLKVEVISKHFEPETIFQQASYKNDQELIMPALQLIKDPQQLDIRVSVEATALSQQNLAQIQQERSAYLNGLATFMQSFTPMIEAKPELQAPMLEMLQWGLSSFSGAKTIEGVLDTAIEQAKQAQQQAQEQPPEEPPEMQLEKMRAEIEMQKIQAKAQADIAVRNNDFERDSQTDLQRHQMRLKEIEASMQSQLSTIEAKGNSDLINEQASMAANIAQSDASARAEAEKDIITMQAELKKSYEEHEMSLAQEAAKANNQNKSTKGVDSTESI